ncbi:MAG TPA: tetratricopeptide repeat protein [Gemmatimonadaceae bacterium]|nr:tetratricopeptide repeat protein [Gemmatimonadaceae bacterium]
MSRRKRRHPEAPREARAKPAPPPASPRGRHRLVWRRLGGATAVIALAVVAGWTFRHSLPGPLRATSFPTSREALPVSRVARGDFVGSERCAACHKAEFAAWSASTHGRAGGVPPDVHVIAAFDGRPIRFRDAMVTPRSRGGAYDFLVAPDGDSAQVIHVDGVVGGGHMLGGGTQGFVTRHADGTYRFVPFDWSRAAGAWFCNTNSRANAGWIPITPRLRLADCGDWPPARVLGDAPRWANCQGCHASQLRVEGEGAARTTRFTSLAINCESCHGPARRHVELAERGRLTAADIGLASLRTLGKDASLDVCFQCHAVKDQLAAGFVSGDSLAQFYSIGLPALGERPLQPDGRVRNFAYQEAHRYSDCYVNGGMTCTSCHDPHSQGYRTITGIPLADRFDDRQCTSCHASKARSAVTGVGPAALAGPAASHTHHLPGTAASRCTSCHMPYLQQPETADPRTGVVAIRYARSDHSIAIPRPRADSALGVKNACMSCHADRSTAQLEADVRRWWGTGKPMPAQVEVQLRVAEARRRAAESARVAGSGSAAGMAPVSELLWRPGPPARPHTAATIGGVATYLELVRAPGDHPPPADVDSLEALARDTSVDVRALALATLHLTAGDDRAVRRSLVEALVHAGAHDFGLRARWALALGAKGDAWAEAGRPEDAAAAYRMAIEVQPEEPATWNSLGNAERALGDFTAALSAYAVALRHRPGWALALVNQGVTRLAVGDTAGAMSDLRAASESDPGEPLAWFNLGNIVLANGDLGAAADLFQRAVAIDASLADADFQLARINLLRREPGEAYLWLRRGLAIDSTNTAARALADQMQRQRSKRD